ncbi:MAG: hypothetical protein NBV68_11025 [Erythrobacter sp.]|uniref:hypothetical protein n=1 Tax=Erythrobacter sp. TaxID=1042 RepID=UPI0025DEAF36|nr:hypothetical protein [Erythrobacter sp.]MCL9999904.1 hypothetical protein [Erythrobacter sp.]
MMARNDKGIFARLDRTVSRLTGRPIHTGFTAPHVVIAVNLIFLLISLAGMDLTIEGRAFGKDLLTLAMFGSIVYNAAVQY